MNVRKRYHPLYLLYNIVNWLKLFFFFILAVLVSLNSHSVFIQYGRIVFCIIFIWSFIWIFVKWFTNKYEVDEHAFFLYKGLFTKKERTITFSKVQSVQRTRSLFHKLFKLTSIRFETGMVGEGSAIEFKVLTIAEADFLEKCVSEAKRSTSELEVEVKDEQLSKRIVHFKPTKRDIIKASFTSLNAFFLIPLLFSLGIKATEIFQMEERVEGVVKQLFNMSWVFLFIIVVLLSIISIAVGMIRTYIKYGKYEIVSDAERIYITKGIVNESAFTIKKDRVQAIEITQSFMKRILRLAEVRLISFGDIGEDSLETNSLYPFLPVKQAYALIPEMLPMYEVKSDMRQLPKKSFWIRMMKPSWFWLIVTAILSYFKPTPFDFTSFWWIASASLFVWIVMLRILDYLHTRFLLNDQFIQMRTGSLETSTFISMREKVIEIAVKRTKMQQLFGLATISTINRADPIRVSEIKDIPVDQADFFYTWYARRVNEIKLTE